MQNPETMTAAMLHQTCMSFARGLNGGTDFAAGLIGGVDTNSGFWSQNLQARTHLGFSAVRQLETAAEQSETPFVIEEMHSRRIHEMPVQTLSTIDDFEALEANTSPLWVSQKTQYTFQPDSAIASGTILVQTEEVYNIGNYALGSYAVINGTPIYDTTDFNYEHDVDTRLVHNGHGLCLIDFTLKPESPFAPVQSDPFAALVEGTTSDADRFNQTVSHMLGILSLLRGNN